MTQEAVVGQERTAEELQRKLWEAEANDEVSREFLAVLGARCKELLALQKELVEALEWYQEKASAAGRYLSVKPPKLNAIEALLTELSLDAGNRASAALARAAQPLPHGGGE